MALSGVKGVLRQRTLNLLAPCAQLHDFPKDSYLTRTEPSALKRGRGGRSSFSGVVATVFGSTGFIGHTLVNQLGKSGTQMILPYRCDHEDTKHLRVMGDLGQIYFTRFDLRDEDSIRKAMKYSNVVINMIGSEWNSLNFTMDDVNFKGAQRIARICKEMNIERFLHVSALNVGLPGKGHYLPNGSEFLNSKTRGEAAVREEFPDVTVIRPSDVYGLADHYFNHYTGFARRHFNKMPLAKGGVDVWKQPIYEGDVARGIEKALYSPETKGQIIEAVGPRRYELKDLVLYMMRLMRRGPEHYHSISNLDRDLFMKLKAQVTVYGPLHPIQFISMDKFERESMSDITRGHTTIEDLGVKLALIEDHAEMLTQNARADQFYKEAETLAEKILTPPFHVAKRRLQI